MDLNSFYSKLSANGHSHKQTALFMVTFFNFLFCSLVKLCIYTLLYVDCTLLQVEVDTFESVNKIFLFLALSCNWTPQIW